MAPTRTYRLAFRISTPTSDVKYFSTRELMDEYISKLITERMKPTGFWLEQFKLTLTIQVIKIEE